MKLILPIFICLLIYSCSKEEQSDNNIENIVELSSNVSMSLVEVNDPTAIYPNPFHNIVSITTSDSNAVVNITNEESLRSFTGKKHHTLGFSEVDPGCYNCEVIYADRVERFLLYKIK